MKIVKKTYKKPFGITLQSEAKSIPLQTHFQIQIPVYYKQNDVFLYKKIFF